MTIVTLTEGNITLRQFEEKDTRILATLANNKKIADNLRDIFPYPYTIQDAEKFIALKKIEDPQTTFAITYKEQFCGVIGLTPQTDVYKCSAEIGYWIGEPFWYKGIATAAVKLLTNFGFDQLGFKRIFAGVFEYNIASVNVLLKNGYAQEGIFNKAVFKNDQLFDELRFSINR